MVEKALYGDAPALVGAEGEQGRYSCFVNRACSVAELMQYCLQDLMGVVSGVGEIKTTTLWSKLLKLLIERGHQGRFNYGFYGCANDWLPAGAGKKEKNHQDAIPSAH